jgi:hypothetical protein
MAGDSDNNVVRPNFQRGTTNSEGGGGDGPSDMSIRRIEERLGAIETEQRSQVRWSVTVSVMIVAVLIAGFGFVLVRMDRSEDKILRLDDRLGRLESALGELPGKIQSSLLQLNQTLLQAITAASTQKASPAVVPQTPSGLPQPEPSKPPG